ncbi:MAG: PCRF domain-containing protein, partial [Clostridia bacterium]|nr:PCRF domain-containing protein [Clostridia bacterium]
MQDKLRAIEDKYCHLEESFSDPSLLANPAEYAKRMKEYRALEPTVTKYRELCAVLCAMQEAEEILRTPGMDADMKALASEEIKVCRETEQILRRELTVLL